MAEVKKVRRGAVIALQGGVEDHPQLERSCAKGQSAACERDPY